MSAISNTLSPALQRLITQMPKAELHIHIEGSLEPELIFELAKRNQVNLPFDDVASLKNAYAFKDLQSFLDIYYAGASVLLKEEDFYDMAYAYLQKAVGEGVVYAEIFFDPQTHTERGIPIQTVIQGLVRATQDGATYLGIESKLIMCFLRHLSQDSALETLKAAEPYLEHLIGVGLDSSEVGHPPEKFTDVFARARKLGLIAVAHAGEEGPPAYIWSALDQLKVLRIDHGVQAIHDQSLIARLAKERTPLTVCPLSNLKLCVYGDLSLHPIKRLLDLGLCVTINSDDPAYFGGYINDNYLHTFQALQLKASDAIAFAKCSFEASFMQESQKNLWYAKIEQHALAHGF
jgi:adenosine deaminase